MELIKDITKQFYPLLILLGCIIFVLWVFFSMDMYGGNGIFEGGGGVYEPMIESDELKNDGLSYTGSVATGYIPIAEYAEGSQIVGGSASFKDMFKVKKENGTVVSGSTEDGFALYLLDITDQAGNYALETLTTEEIEGLEEIPAAFIYDREKDILYFHSSGTYIVHIKIYGMDGGQRTYEFRLPVEAS